MSSFFLVLLHFPVDGLLLILYGFVFVLCGWRSLFFVGSMLAEFNRLLSVSVIFFKVVLQVAEFCGILRTFVCLFALFCLSCFCFRLEQCFVVFGEFCKYPRSSAVFVRDLRLSVVFNNCLVPVFFGFPTVFGGALWVSAFFCGPLRFSVCFGGLWRSSAASFQF